MAGQRKDDSDKGACFTLPLSESPKTMVVTTGALNKSWTHDVPKPAIIWYLHEANIACMNLSFPVLERRVSWPLYDCPFTANLLILSEHMFLSVTSHGRTFHPDNTARD